jgi:hypothetical protein
VNAWSDPALFRLLIVVSVAIAFATYTRFHLVGGGSLTGGYLAILLLSEQWFTLVGLLIATVVTLVMVRGVILRVVALPRSWVFVLSVLMSALTTLVLPVLLPALQSLTGALGLAITFGAYVVPGLIAYDISHQGFGRTILGIIIVTAGTLVVCLPAFALMSGLPHSTANVAPYVERVSPTLLPYAIVSAIVIGAVLRFTFDLRTGGFIGALFIVEFYSVQAFIAVGAAAVSTHLLMRLYQRYVVMSPRQRSMGALILGALIAWASMYWASSLGWVSAMEANAYTLSPLLAVGLMAADAGRSNSGMLRTLLGTGIAVIAIAITLWLTQTFGFAVGALALAVIAAGLTPAVLGLVRSWQAAERSGLARTGRISP